MSNTGAPPEDAFNGRLFSEMTVGMTWSDAELARLRLEGLEHLVRLRSGLATESDALAFLDWRTQSPAHEAAFRSAVHLQRLVFEAAREPNLHTGKGALFTLVSRREAMYIALAASFAAIAFVFGRSLDLVPDPERLTADYSTGAGERRYIVLTEGAGVDLNTRTNIVLRHDLGMPAVELLTGEAILSSAAEKTAALVAARGTCIGRDGRFNTRREDDTVRVTCLSGTVEVTMKGRTRVLKPQEEVRYDDRVLGTVVTADDPAAQSAWESGTLIFRKMTMRDVVAEINRYRQGKVILTNAQLADRRLTGTYYVDRLDDFFAQAELGLGAKVTRLPGDVIILG